MLRRMPWPCLWRKKGAPVHAVFVISLGFSVCKWTLKSPSMGGRLTYDSWWLRCEGLTQLPASRRRLLMPTYLFRWPSACLLHLRNIRSSSCRNLKNLPGTCRQPHGFVFGALYLSWAFSETTWASRVQGTYKIGRLFDFRKVKALVYWRNGDKNSGLRVLVWGSCWLLRCLEARKPRPVNQTRKPNTGNLRPAIRSSITPQMPNERLFSFNIFI